MITLAFSKAFVRAMCGCRAAVYLWLLGGVALTHGQALSLAGFSKALLPCATAALAWCCAAWLLGRPRPRLLLLALHLVEGCLLLLAARVWGLPMLPVLWLAVIVLAANAALWGWRHSFHTAIAAFGGLLTGGFISGSWMPAAQAPHIWLDVWSVSGGVVFVVTVCAVAHHQAEGLLSVSRQLRAQKSVLLRYLPADLSKHLQQASRARVRSEWATVAFVDMAGFTRATRELPTPALAELVNRFIATVDAHVTAWDGQVSKFLGDGVLCVFPATSHQTRINAARQAVRCVAQLPEVLAVLPQLHCAGDPHVSVSVRCGVASGYCCSGHWGGSGRLDYTVIGNPVNLAQRLQSVAGAHGGILLDENTQQLSAGVLQAATPGKRLLLKGFGEVAAYPLASASGAGAAEAVNG